MLFARLAAISARSRAVFCARPAARASLRQAATHRSASVDSPASRLTEAETNLVLDETAFLTDLGGQLRNLGAQPEDLHLLAGLRDRLQSLFMLVVVGEFNAGKSSFVNALLGEKVSAEGVTPTTSRVYLIQHGEREEENLELAGHDEPGAPRGSVAPVTVKRPLEWLRQLVLVDTPGTNAVLQHHETITRDFVPQCDLVLFVTSADRPFAESERQFMSMVRGWGKKVVIVCNKVDLFQNEGEVEQVRQFINKQCLELLDLAPTLFFVSARKGQLGRRLDGEPPAAAAAVTAAAGGDHTAESISLTPEQREAAWNESRMQDVLDYITQTLQSKEQLRIKLASPLGVADTLLAKYGRVTSSRLDLLAGDHSSLELMRQYNEEHVSDMRRGFTDHFTRMDNIVLRASASATEFIDSKVRLRNVFAMMKPDQLQAEFVAALGDSTGEMERHMHDLVDWSLDRNSRHWRSTMGLVQQRLDHQQVHEQEQQRQLAEGGACTGSASSNFLTAPGLEQREFIPKRVEMMNNLRDAAQEATSQLDRDAFAKSLSATATRSLVETAAVQASALGVGGALLFASMFDVMGILSTSSLAVLGLAVVPFRRRQAKEQIKESLQSTRQTLRDALANDFETELDNYRLQLETACRPFTRFVEREQQRAAASHQALQEARDYSKRLKSKVEAIA